uniref:Peptidase A2 domain-containing protein n=1 Tax=Strongyloides stercoralis TaxID=6248 RepID=A0AAF5DRC7_STRER
MEIKYERLLHNMEVPPMDIQGVHDKKTYRGHPVYGANADIDLNKLFSTIRETCESVEKAGSVTAKKILPYLVVLGKEFTLLKKKSGPYGASSSNISGVLNETLETLQRSIQTSVAIKLKEFKDGDCRAFIKQLEDAYKDNDARLEALERLVKGTARMAWLAVDNTLKEDWNAVKQQFILKLNPEEGKLSLVEVKNNIRGILPMSKETGRIYMLRAQALIKKTRYKREMAKYYTIHDGCIDELIAEFLKLARESYVKPMELKKPKYNFREKETSNIKEHKNWKGKNNSSEDNKEFDIYRVDLFENNKIVTKISIEGIPLMALLDTGSDVCLLSSKIYKTFKQCTIKTKLHKVTNMKVCDVQGNVLKLLGGITLKAYNVDIPFLVVEHTLNGYDAILGAKQLKRVKELKKKLI